MSKLNEGRAYKAVLDGPKNENNKVAAVNRGGYFRLLFAIIKRFVSPIPVFPNIT